jgi:hypothetical protein
MQLRAKDPESIERRLAELAWVAEQERQDRRAFLWTCALLVLWPIAGVLGMGWGFQMDDPVWGPAIFLGSAAGADLGILGTVVAAYRRAA